MLLNNQEQTPLLDALVDFSGRNPAYFRIPAHRFAGGVNPRLLDAFGEGVFRCDLSEAEGLDDLHRAEGVIKQAQDLAADLWGAKRTFFLVNGTTCGNEAMVLATAHPGDKVLIPRNAHKSLLMGMIMSGADPFYVMPHFDEEWKLWGSVGTDEIRNALEREAYGCKSVFLVSPTYYGVCSDLSAISKVCHEHGALLCVDEAHGSHLYFSDKLPKGALRQGADMCAQSIHKTAGSMTQSSLLQIGSERVSQDQVTASLQMVQSTSPSYVLMASLDAARQELAQHGDEMMGRALALSDLARRQLQSIPGIQVLQRSGNNSAIFDLDPLRLVFSARELHISGYRMQRLLYEESGVSTELADEENVVCVITFGNTEKDIDRLVRGVRRISGDAVLHRESVGEDREKFSMTFPKKILTPRDAYFHKKRKIKWEDVRGRISGEMIVPYPPGIPLIYPGEMINDEVFDQIDDYKRKGISIHGPADSQLNTLQIIL